MSWPPNLSAKSSPSIVEVLIVISRKMEWFDRSDRRRLRKKYENASYHFIRKWTGLVDQIYIENKKTY